MADSFAMLRHQLEASDPALSRALQGERRVPRRMGRDAAVLILLSDTARPDLVVTERAAHLSRHAGQVSFPGGRREVTDADAVATALREAHEEIGLRPDSVDVLGTLPAAHVAASGFDVVSVVGTWAGGDRVGVVDPAEVAAVYRVRIEDLADPDTRRTARHSSGYLGPAFVLPDPYDTASDLVIWGFTAHLIDRLLPLGGWERPWDRTRQIPVPERFLRSREEYTRPAPPTPASPTPGVDS